MEPVRVGTILLVEDDFDTLNIQRTVLEFEGHKVTPAGNGLEALRVLERERPDVIVLDLMMPVMDGLTFLRKRQDMGLGAVPVVCVTAAGREMAEDALALGAVHCLQKPADFEVLCAVVKEYCRA